MEMTPGSALQEGIVYDRVNMLVEGLPQKPERFHQGDRERTLLKSKSKGISLGGGTRAGL